MCLGVVIACECESVGKDKHEHYKVVKSRVNEGVRVLVEEVAFAAFSRSDLVLGFTIVLSFRFGLVVLAGERLPLVCFPLI